MRHFAFTLAKNLGRTIKELDEVMDAPEFIEWMAYEMSCDSDFRKKVDDEIALERSAKRTAEQRAEDIKRMFTEIGATNGFAK